MKAFCVLMCLGLPVLAFGSLSSSVDDILHMYEKDCAQKTGTNSSSIELARKHRKIPDNGELDLFAVCMLKKFNIMDKEGNVQNQAYKIFSDNVYISQISDKCKVMRGQDIGETARKIMNCFQQANEIMLALKSWPNKDTGYIFNT